MRNYRYPNLWHGCVGAWCPSQDRGRSERLTDFSNRNNHGTLTNMDPVSDWVASEGKTALDFDGTNDYIQISRGSEDWLKIDYSITAWCRVAAAGNYPMMVSVGSNAELRLFGTGGRPEIQFNAIAATGPDSIVNTGWRALVGTYDGTKVSFYLDGRLVTYTTLTFTPSQSSSLQIGSRAGSLLYTGQLDDIRIYNRALSASEANLLAIRRGVAFETKRLRVGRRASAKSGTNMLVGCGL